MAEYRKEEYVDGTNVNVCLTQASNPWTMTFFLMTISAFFILPLVILIILYTIIAKNLISKDGAMHRIRPSKPEQSLKARKQVVVMLGAVVLSFFLCLLPFRILTLWIILAPDEKLSNFGFENYYTVLYFCRIMLYLNSAVNPILYNLMSSKFRKGFKKVYCCFIWKNSRLVNGRPRVQTLNTATTSSFLTHSSVSRKSECHKTLSLDDLRIKECTYNDILPKSPTGSLHWNHYSIKRAVTDTNGELRKIAINNFGRQKSYQSSDDEWDMKKYNFNADEPSSPSSAGNSSKAFRQTSYDEGVLQQHPKKKLLFQYSLDERTLITAKRFPQTDSATKENNKKCSNNDQSIVPFLR